MKWCQNCKKEFADEANFCNVCGGKLEKKTADADKPMQKAKEAPKKTNRELLNKKASFSGMRILIAVGIFVLLAVAIISYHWGAQNAAKDEMTEIYTEEQGTDTQSAEDFVAEMPSEQMAEPSVVQKQEIGWVCTAAGANFYVPEDFVQTPIEEAIADVHQYENEKLGMKIMVWEIPFSEADSMRAPQDVIKDDYFRMLSIYDGRTTYQAVKDDFYVISGYEDDDTIFYSKLMNIEDRIYTTLEFTYPKENQELCGQILTTFLEGLVYQ